MHFFGSVVAAAIVKASQVGDCCEVEGGVIELLRPQALIG